MRSRRRVSRLEFPRPENANPVDLPEDEALSLLKSGEVIGGHRMPWGSNYTFLVWIDAGPAKYLRAVYKPGEGERPLWDFDAGSLYKREHAAFMLSRILGWPDVPLTLVREGPYGVGSMQLYVESDPNVTYFDLMSGRIADLEKFAVFDLIANNADRKAGHCLLGPDGRIWSIDHGLTFHASFKVRSVMLEFWGKPIPMSLLTDLEALLSSLEDPDPRTTELANLIHGRELKALAARTRAILKEPVLPILDPYNNVPWPFV